MKTLNNDNNYTSIDISKFPCGVYVVAVKKEKEIALKKFVKEQQTLINKHFGYLSNLTNITKFVQS